MHVLRTNVIEKRKGNTNGHSRDACNIGHQKQSKDTQYKQNKHNSENRKDELTDPTKTFQVLDACINLIIYFLGTFFKYFVEIHLTKG